MESEPQPVPARVVEATRRQLSHRDALLARGATRIGWKLGRDFPEIEAVIGKQPVLGYLTSASAIADGSDFAITSLRAPRVETELAIVVGVDLPADPAPGDATRAIAGVAVALEIVDVARPPDTLEGIIEHNLAHRAVVAGPVQSIGRCGTTARLLIDDEVRETADVPADAPARLSQVARLLAAVDLRLAPGDLVLSGSLTHVAAITGAQVTAEIDGLGSVRVGLTP